MLTLAKPLSKVRRKPPRRPEVKPVRKPEHKPPPYIADSGLYQAVRAGDARAVRLLLEKGVNPRERWLHTFPPLLMAVLFGHVEVAEVLLGRGMDVNEDFRGSLNALLCAVRTGSEEMVNLLLKHGAKTETKFGGREAFYLAENCGYEKVAEKLGAKDRPPARADRG